MLHNYSSPYEIFLFYDVGLVRVTLAIKRFSLVVEIKDKSAYPVLAGEKSGERAAS
jgi:hypothetical protein